MGLANALVWGVVQGVTEFIPVSSSGHLVIIPRLFGVEAPDIAYNIYLHLGTLAAVVVYFRKDISALFKKGSALGPLVLAGSIPVMIAGTFFADAIGPFFQDPRTVGSILFVNGCILFLGHARLKASVSGSHVTVRRAIVIGVFQAFAMLPGISRSGITITSGIYTGVERKEAYRFSFLLFIPVAVLAFLYALKEASFEVVLDGGMIAGACVSALVGVFMLKALYALMARARFHYLGAYCVLTGALAFFLF